MRYKVYYLLNPIDESIFYVGRTRSSLLLRLQRHLWCKGKSNKPLYDKIQDIVSCGHSPEIHLIEETNYLQREMEIIKEFNKKHKLLNVQSKPCIIQ